MSGLFAARDGRRVPPVLRHLSIDRQSIRLPDRVGFSAGDFRRHLLMPVGRPNDLNGDVLVTLPRLRFGGAS